MVTQVLSYLGRVGVEDDSAIGVHQKSRGAPSCAAELSEQRRKVKRTGRYVAQRGPIRGRVCQCDQGHEGSILRCRQHHTGLARMRHGRGQHRCVCDPKPRQSCGTHSRRGAEIENADTAVERCKQRPPGSECYRRRRPIACLGQHGLQDEHALRQVAVQPCRSELDQLGIAARHHVAHRALMQGDAAEGDHYQDEDQRQDRPEKDLSAQPAQCLHLRPSCLRV